MQPHTHISAVQLLAPVLAVIIVLGTIHLLTLTKDNRFANAFKALGF